MFTSPRFTLQYPKYIKSFLVLTLSARIRQFVGHFSDPPKMPTAILVRIDQNCTHQSNNDLSNAAHTETGIASLGLTLVRAQIALFVSLLFSQVVV